MTTTSAQSVDFDFNAAFVSVQSQDQGAEFEVLNDKDERTGFFICLAGPDSARRKRTHARLTDFYLKSGIGAAKQEPRNRKQRRAAATGEERYGGDTSIEMRQLQLDDMVAATISWRFPEGKTGPECNETNARHLYTIHPTLFEQVIDAADDITRFTKR